VTISGEGQAVLDFDNIDGWAPKLADALESLIPNSVGSGLVAAAPEYTEDARNVLFRLTDRDAIIDAALAWVCSTTVAGYHGTRLTDAEVASVLAKGLIPLRAEDRSNRLARALSPCPRWDEVAGGLDAAIQAHGQGGCAGYREGQVHLTLSRSGLTDGFKHYLTHGAEFDQRVAGALLGQEGVDLLGRDGMPRVIQVAVPGAVALKAAHPHFGVDVRRARGDVPNLVDEFLKAWSYRLVHSGFQSRSLKVDCGMVFRSTVPCAWILNIETLPDRH
jgi:hypothetical protein